MGRGRARVGRCGAIAVLALLARRLRRRKPPQRPAAASCRSGSASRSPRRRSRCSRQPIGVGPARTQQIPQNQNQPQPPIKGDHGPLTVSIVIANQTRTDSKLELRGPRDVSSVAIPAGSPGDAADRPAHRHLRGRRRQSPRRPLRQARRSARSAPLPRTTSCFLAVVAGDRSLQAAFPPARSRPGRVTVDGHDRRPRNRRGSARRRARLRARLTAGGAGRAARFRRRRAGGRLARGRRFPAQPDPGQRRGPQARRQDRGGVAGQAPDGDRQRPGGDQGTGRAHLRGPEEDRSRGSQAAAKPTCRPGPCSNRSDRPSATSTPRPPA